MHRWPLWLMSKFTMVPVKTSPSNHEALSQKVGETRCKICHEYLALLFIYLTSCKSICRTHLSCNQQQNAFMKNILLYVERIFQITRCKCQVINIGAGFDTLYWNLKDEGLAPSNFIELDFPDVTMRKCHYIKTRPPLLKSVHSEGVYSFLSSIRL